MATNASGGRLSAARSAAFSWVYANRVELALLLLLTMTAAVPRVAVLTGVPPGLHGDEANTGIRARAILDGARIGPFDPHHGLGQPAGMEYFTAGFVKLFGNTIFTIRLAMALFGMATVPLVYLLMRALRFERATAVIAGLLLAFMSWHIHYSRIALPPVSLPFFEVLTCLLLAVAVRSMKWWQFTLAGVALGMGIYTYSSYNFFAVGVLILAAYWVVRAPAARRVALAARLCLVIAVAVVAAAPMLSYILGHYDSYSSYPRTISIFRSHEYRAADGVLAKADVVADSGKSFVQRAVFNKEPDLSDGANTGPMLDTLFSMLLGIGILLALRRFREPGAALPLIFLLVLPWAGILTEGGGLVRRATGVTPFLAMLAALPLGELLRRTGLARSVVRAGAYFVVAAVVICVSVLDLRAYFHTFSGDSLSQYAFTPEMVAASEYVDTLPKDTRVYFYSDRWSFDYEIRRYLAPDYEGEDRSKEFGRYSLDIDNQRPAALVFLGNYVDQLKPAEELYPGGEPSEKTIGYTYYRALFLPKGVPSTKPPTAEQPTAAELSTQYTVQADDTPPSIASHFGIDLKYLLAANPELRADEPLIAGQALVVPAGNGALHVLLPGETLADVAAFYHVTVDGIVAWPANGISSAEGVHAGQLIFIPNADVSSVLPRP